MQQGLDWLQQRTARRLTAKLVEPSQEKFTWIHALRPEFAHMFQSYARGEKERKGIESYLFRLPIYLLCLLAACLLRHDC